MSETKRGDQLLAEVRDTLRGARADVVAALHTSAEPDEPWDLAAADCVVDFHGSVRQFLARHMNRKPRHEDSARQTKAHRAARRPSRRGFPRNSF